MSCPYCLSDIAEDVLVCPNCTRDLYLIKQLQRKIDELELKLQDFEELQERLHVPGSGDEQSSPDVYGPAVAIPLFRLADWATYFFPPLLLLLAAHTLIVVVYDFNTLVLRIVSLLIPLPFAFFLMLEKRAFLQWLGAWFFLSLLAVFGMSGITSLVDHTSVMPQNAREWREFIEYAASIWFSGITGMILGNMRRMKREAAERARVDKLTVKLVNVFSTGKQGAEKLYSTVIKLREVTVTLTAAGTTAVATYAGLKGVMGW